MNTFLLNWNPKYFDWEDNGLDDHILTISKFGSVKGRWSCGKLKKIRKGDRIFLTRLGTEPKGIVASGFALTSPYPDKKWNEPRKESLYIDIKYDCILDARQNDILRLEYLAKLPMNWAIQAAQELDSMIANKVERYWRELSQVSTIYPNEVIDNKKIVEGTMTRVLVNTYERNPEARRICVEHHGVTCVVCGFNFEKKYGDIGRDFIHVHHLKPLNEIKKQYRVDPIRDLAPVCPNCHAMLHRRSDTLSIQQLKKLIKSR